MRRLRNIILRAMASRLLRGVVAGFLAVALLGAGMKLDTWRDDQIILYDQAMSAYLTGDLETAVQLFDRSIAAYEHNLGRTEQEVIIYGAASRELAAQAYFHKGMALLAAQQVRPAIEALMESLRLNSGNHYEDWPENLSTADIDRLTDQALTVKYNLELIFRLNSSQSQQSQGDPQPAEQGDQPVPGTRPGAGQSDGGGAQL